jgi:hypothetical protein
MYEVRGKKNPLTSSLLLNTSLRLPFPPLLLLFLLVNFHPIAFAIYQRAIKLAIFLLLISYLLLPSPTFNYHSGFSIHYLELFLQKKH